MEENEEKPFWAQFLKSDYGKPAEKPAPLLPMILDVLDGNASVNEMQQQP